MTAAAAGSLAYLADVFEPVSTAHEMKAWQHAEAALAWLDGRYKGAAPLAPDTSEGKAHGFWCLERAGVEWGCERFGAHDWFREGAENLVRSQAPNGSWCGIEETAFSLLFLYEGRVPIPFEKLRFSGDWNQRPRDLAKLVDYTGRWG
jgi:hypothetical protein